MICCCIFPFSGYHDRSPFVQLYLCLLSQTELIINAEYTLSLLEAKINFRDKYRFERSSASEGTSRWYVNWKNKTKRLEHLQSLQSLTFQCEMHSLQCHSENGLEPIENALEPIENDEVITNPTASIVTSIADSYTWFIDDPSMIKEMSSAPNVHGFNSPIFKMHGFKWYITVSPNGSMVERDGKVTVSLTLASLPRADMKVLVKQRLYFGEKVVECLVTFDAESNSYRGAPFGNEYTTAEMKAMRFLSFTAEIEVIEIMESSESGQTLEMFEINAEDEISETIVSVPSYIVNYLGDNHQKLEKYEWTIDDEIDLWALERGDFLDFPMDSSVASVMTKSFTFHGLSWSLEMDYNGKIALILNRKHLKGWELEINHTLCIRFTVSLLELGTRFPSSAYFDGTKISKDWGEHRVDVDKLLKLKELTIQLQMEMIDIHPM